MGLRKVFTYAAIWSVILIGFYLISWRPHMRHLKKLRSQMVMQQNVINQLKKDIEAYPKTITAETLKKVEANLEGLFARIPAQEELPSILKQIRQYSVKSTSFKITEMVWNVTSDQKRDPQASSIPKMEYQVTAEGNAQDIMRFLYELENGARLIAIEDFTLRRIDEGNRSIRANFTLNLFYSKPSDGGQGGEK